MEKTTFELQDVLNTQLKFQEKFGFVPNESHTKEELMALIHTHSHFAVEEVFEMLRELPHHKYWADYSNLTDEDWKNKIGAAKEEWIDVFIFMMNVALFLGMDQDEIFEKYKNKQKINVERQQDPDLGYVK